MKILVCISKAPDTTTKISFTDNNTKFNTDKVTYIVNPYDEWYALVRGLELKESLGGSVTTITVGTAADEPTIRKALAIGADNAVRVDAEATDAFFVANQIATYAKENNFDLVLCGKETIDYNGSQVGGMVAALMDAPFISLGSSLEVNDKVATVVRDIPGGTETLEADLPAVISAAKGMAEQRIPNMRGIMAARTKPLEVIPAVGDEKLTSVKSYALPPEKGDCKYVDPENVAELVDLLHNEAKVI
ncbi:electron transfer flavoprotein subunit beta/FixA family protein [Luteibaculum oceani]|uniref:Electron transfer flavoprotein subunit beta n=1 Tax=Luteibaculum oceani TaxID=1294296 RepID=A0A5C6V3U7_9FLAO|nr:electron transfer flavoprotein subunit beta/FixA family protein [Luteibaculum oceani]TXC78318.1 electron transfer flavoprotein subunit beta/FixA family protein [Luteibaculum oceani]